MRRKEQHIINGAVIVGGLSAIFDVLLQLMEHSNEGKKFTWESYDGTRTIKNALKGAAIGSAVGYTFYQYKISQEDKIPFNSDNYLKKILTSEDIKKNKVLYKKVNLYLIKLKKLLSNSFEGLLAGPPENAGSFYKNTAINSNYDLDIVLPFKKNSFNTLEEMYNYVFETIGAKLSYKANVIKQTKSIGLTFSSDSQIVHFDIVPGKEINNYKIDKDLNLYVRPEWFWQRSSCSKTNTKKHKIITKNNPDARRVIKILKRYKLVNNYDVPSIIIEQGVVDALSDNNFGINKSHTDNLLNSMDYISRKLQSQVYIDISNTNINLLDKMSSSQKIKISNQLITDVERIENRPRYIKEILE